MRNRESWSKASYRTVACVLLTLAAAGNVVAAPEDRGVRTPRKSWDRNYDAGQERLTLLNRERAVAIDMRISASPSTTAPDLDELVLRLTGQTIEGKRLRMPKSVLEKAEVQMGISFALSDGRRGIYREIWRQRPDGLLGVTGYLAVATEFNEQHAADFKLVRGLGNQLSRGIALIAPDRPRLAVEPETAMASLPTPVAAPTVSPEISVPVPDVAVSVPVPSVAIAVSAPVADTPIPVVIASTPAVSVPVPVVSAPVVVTSPVTPNAVLAPIAQAPIAVPVIAAAAPTVASSAASYPFVATAGAGVPMGQIASILYAPLESSEIFVLFKDGSFHENLPVALEQWNLAGSRSNDPASWGKWKPAEDAGDYEMHYAADDVVTISATKIKPAKTGMVIEGSYVKSNASENSSDEIRFKGDHFEISRLGARDSGTYRVDGYSVILTHDSGKVEHLPFFIVPPEEDEDDPSIWLGDSLHERVE